MSSEVPDEESTGGRRRRARGEKGFERALDSDSIADREDVLTVPVAPASRLVSLAVAAVRRTARAGPGLRGVHRTQSYGLVIFGVQVLFVISWTVATRPPGPRVVAAVGLAAAAAADLAVAWPVHATIAPLGYVTAAAFVVGTLGQLARRAGRQRVTESLGSTLVMVIGVVAYATLIVLSRHVLGKESIAACLVAATVGIVVARLSDVIVPYPADHPTGGPRHDRHHRRRDGRHGRGRRGRLGTGRYAPESHGATPAWYRRSPRYWPTWVSGTPRRAGRSTARSVRGGWSVTCSRRWARLRSRHRWHM